MKKIDIKEVGGSLEITETRTIETKERVTVQVIIERLATLRERRAMDAKSFSESLAKTDAEIAELEGILSQADQVIKAKEGEPRK